MRPVILEAISIKIYWNCSRGKSIMKQTQLFEVCWCPNVWPWAEYVLPIVSLWGGGVGLFGSQRVTFTLKVNVTVCYAYHYAEHFHQVILKLLTDVLVWSRLISGMDWQIDGAITTCLPNLNKLSLVHINFLLDSNVKWWHAYLYIYSIGDNKRSISFEMKKPSLLKRSN